MGLRPAFFLGSVFSYALYGFFYFIRESFRVFTSQLGGSFLLELSAKENFYYNLFYSAIATVVGVYISLKFLFENASTQGNGKVRLRQRQNY